MRNLLLALCFVIAVPALGAPHVTIVEARKIALARVPGTIVHEKLKHAKKKHKHDQYNIKIKPRDATKKDTVRKVAIDAETGVILEIKDVKAKAYDTGD